MIFPLIMLLLSNWFTFIRFLYCYPSILVFKIGFVIFLKVLSIKHNNYAILNLEVSLYYNEDLGNSDRRNRLKGMQKFNLAFKILNMNIIDIFFNENLDHVTKIWKAFRISSQSARHAFDTDDVCGCTYRRYWIRWAW